MGKILKAIYERQLDGEITTLEQGIALAGTLSRKAKHEDVET